MDLEPAATETVVTSYINLLHVLSFVEITVGHCIKNLMEGIRDSEGCKG